MSLTCTNCGDPTGEAPKRCAMRDRCIPSQANFLNQKYGNKIYDLMANGLRYADEARPLCWTCFNANGGVCAHCELEKSLEN